MIKLKDILLEGEYIDHKWYPKHTQEALRYVLSQVDVPIYPKIMSKVIGKLPITAFHVTGVSYLDGVKHMLGTKKSMSTFNRASASNLLGKGKGIWTEGGIILQVEGTLLAKSFQDLGSAPDKTGRRWVSALNVFGDKMIVKSAAKKDKNVPNDSWAFRDMEKEVEEKWEVKGKQPWDKEVEDAKNKLASKVIAAYIDMTNKLLIKHKKLVQKNLASPANKKQQISWNEIMIYNAKVKDAFVLNRIGNKFTDKERKSLESMVNGKITYGTPTKYRKWLTDRKGILDE
mgnify:FL=1